MTDKINLSEGSDEFKAIKDKWYEAAKVMDLDALPVFLKQLTEQYNHDYGTICHAMSAGAVATMWAMNKSDQGGITGFQAGAVMWEFIRVWNYTHNKTGLRILDYDDLLYPQNEDKFAKKIYQNCWEALKAEAQKNLDTQTEHVAPHVLDHWQSIVNDTLPFDFVIKED